MIRFNIFVGTELLFFFWIRIEVFQLSETDGNHGNSRLMFLWWTRCCDGALFHLSSWLAAVSSLFFCFYFNQSPAHHSALGHASFPSSTNQKLPMSASRRWSVQTLHDWPVYYYIPPSPFISPHHHRRAFLTLNVSVLHVTAVLAAAPPLTNWPQFMCSELKN